MKRRPRAGLERDSRGPSGCRGRAPSRGDAGACFWQQAGCPREQPAPHANGGSLCTGGADWWQGPLVPARAYVSTRLLAMNRPQQKHTTRAVKGSNLAPVFTASAWSCQSPGLQLYTPGLRKSPRAVGVPVPVPVGLTGLRHGLLVGEPNAASPSLLTCSSVGSTLGSCSHKNTANTSKTSNDGLNRSKHLLPTVHARIYSAVRT